MAYNYNRPREDAAPVEQKQPEVLKGRDDYPDDGCPECGYVPTDQKDATKHAIGHYGDLELPNHGHLNIVARRRQAVLMGWDIPKQ